MSTGSHQPHGYSKACWRCQDWGDFAHGGATHSLCKHPKSSPVQASPANGCACWSPGEGDSKPADWVSVGFKSQRGSDPIADRREPPSPVPQRRPIDERPAGQLDAFVFDQKADAHAWRTTDSLLSRARRRWGGP
jgi:hypothetical protein